MSEHHAIDSSIVKEELTDRAAADNGHLALLGCGGHDGKICFLFLGRDNPARRTGLVRQGYAFKEGL